MTPLPKKKHAKARTNTRKAAITFKLPSLIVCPNCQSLKFPHRICPNCKSYGKKVDQKEQNQAKTA